VIVFGIVAANLANHPALALAFPAVMAIDATFSAVWFAHPRRAADDLSHCLFEIEDRPYFRQDF